MWLRLRAMLVKEFLQVFRDKRTRFLLFGPPIIQMVIFGYAATLEIEHVPMAILDYENSQVSRDFVSRFQGSRYFQVRVQTLDRERVRRMVDHGDVLLAVQVNAGFSEQLRKGQTAPVQVILDASNSNTALVSLGYVNQIASKFSQDYPVEMLDRTSPAIMKQIPSIVLERQPWFNPDLSSQWYFVPGVMGNLITIVIVVLTAFAVVREREIGTLEQIMVTPIGQAEFILGKTIPFFLIGLLDAALITAVGTFWFRVPLRGSLLVLLAGTVLYLFCALGVGLLISTLSENQQQAMVSAFFFLMPAIIFSGFATPISSMPAVLQLFTYADPLRYFIIILRGVFLKGVGFAVLWPQMASLGVFAALMLLASVLRFHKSLD
jgi:ABC-2 type transport system permease protein